MYRHSLSILCDIENSKSMSGTSLMCRFCFVGENLNRAELILILIFIILKGNVYAQCQKIFISEDSSAYGGRKQESFFGSVLGRSLIKAQTPSESLKWNIFKWNIFFCEFCMTMLQKCI